MTEIAPAPTEAPSLLRHQPLRNFVLGRLMSELASQMAVVAIGWQVYALTGSAFALGLVGLAQFVPSMLLIFIGGHVADRYERKRIVALCQAIEGLAIAGLAAASLAHALTVTQIYATVVVLGIAGAFERPAASALLPGVAPAGNLSRASALSTSTMHLATVAGPAIGGLVYALAPAAAYATVAVLTLAAAALNATIALKRVPLVGAPPTLSTLFSGIHFVRDNPTLLGTISLDLFAVLLGGATALMPIYAHDILHTGAWGLGILRGAPALGALAMTAVLARYPIERKVGLRMFQAVIVFGLATIVFALSRTIGLSLIALVIMGAADTVSMVIRILLVQLSTPDDMRGRVGAVNFLFIGASNELGEFESGVTAGLLGAVPAAVAGGIGTVLVALLWMWLFPKLRAADGFE